MDGKSLVTQGYYPIIDKEKTGIRLEKLMNANGLTPKDICDYLSLSCVQTVYRWFEGINIPSIDNLYALSQLFCTGIDNMIIGNRRVIKHRQVTSAERRVAIYMEKICMKKVA